MPVIYVKLRTIFQSNSGRIDLYLVGYGGGGTSDPMLSMYIIAISYVPGTTLYVTGNYVM